MIINCEQCNKKFEVESNLIPAEGRMLQCGSCEHKWFYKNESINENNIILDKETQDNEINETKISESNESIKNQVLLQKVPIFNYLNTPDIQLIAEVCERKMYEEKEYIVKQNDNDQSLFIIADGVVSVQLNKDDGNCSEIDKLGVGDFFGEMSLMTGEPRAADIVTLTPTLVLEIKKEIMEKILTENPTFSGEISIILAERQIDLSNARLSGERKSAEVRKLSNIIKTAIMRFFN